MTESNQDKTAHHGKADAAPAKKYSELLMTMRAEFETRRVAIRKDIGRGLSSDSKERAVQLENADTLNALLDEAEQQLEQIDHAIQRINEGRYGFCEQCEEKIQPNRLQVFPQTTTCISCAESNA